MAKEELSPRPGNYALEIEILREYDLYPAKIKEVRGGFKVRTQRGDKFLKRISDNDQQALFINAALEHLGKNGFKRIARFLQTKYGENFVLAEGSCYYVTDWLDVKEADLKKKEQFWDAAMTLAEMHRASEGFIPPPNAPQKNWGTWNHILSNRLNRIRETLHILDSRGTYTPFEEAFRNSAETFINQGTEALQALEVSGYPGFLADTGFAFCHRDYTSRNILRDRDGYLYIVDFDHARVEPSIHDLGRFLARYAHRFDWDSSIIQIAIDNYNDVLELFPHERQALIAYLRFPHRWYQLVENHNKNSKDWPEEKFANKLTKLEGTLARETEFCQTLASMNNLELQFSFNPVMSLSSEHQEDLGASQGEKEANEEIRQLVDEVILKENRGELDSNASITEIKEENLTEKTLEDTFVQSDSWSGQLDRLDNLKQPQLRVLTPGDLENLVHEDQEVLSRDN